MRRLDAAFGLFGVPPLGGISAELTRPRKRGTPNLKRRQAGALQNPCLKLNQVNPAAPASVEVAAR